ncbi:MAG: DPP IV N-terminal domain-containing protein, partial [Vicinamibacteria bacterium]
MKSALVIAATSLVSTGWTISAQETLTIERLASFPRLTGTAPSAPVWSPDGRSLAFLWNDAGLPFRDLWVVGRDGSGLKRLTNLAEEPRGGFTEEPPSRLSFEEVRRKTEERLRAGISDARFSPDGDAIIIIYGGNIYRVPAGGGDPTRLTSSGGWTRSPGFSPDGTFLSYLRDGDFWLRNRKTNDEVRATELGVPAKGVLPIDPSTYLDAGIVSYRWSPDGSAVALEYENRERVRKLVFPDYLGEETEGRTLRRDLPGDRDARRSIAVLRVSSGRPAFLDLPEPNDRRIASYEWSPDGKALLVDESSENAEDRYLYLFDLESGARREIFHSHYAPNGSTTSASTLWTSTFRSDGRAVLFVSDRGGRHHLWSVSIEGGEPVAVTEGEWSTVGAAYEGSGLTLAPAARKAFFLSTKKNPYERQVYEVAETGGAVSQITTLPGTHAFLPSPDGTTLALIHSSDVTPPELYLIEARPGAIEKRVTESPSPEFARHPWIAPAYVTFKSRIDGVTLHGRLL